MKRSSIVVLLGVVLSVWTMVRAELFKDGETVCFLGDSITNGGRYQNMIYNYYLTRFPSWTIRFVNAGRSGDSAGGSLGRLQEDVIDKKPNSVAVMFGMNDVNRGAYVANADANKLKAQQQALDSYKSNMEKLVGRIRTEAKEPKLYFITPSPFDQTVVLDKENNQPGCNDGLGRCAEIVRGLAATNNAMVVDFHGPMTALNLEQQKKDPKYTLVGGDRVHPRRAGTSDDGVALPEDTGRSSHRFKSGRGCCSRSRDREHQRRSDRHCEEGWRRDLYCTGEGPALPD